MEECKVRLAAVGGYSEATCCTFSLNTTGLSVDGPRMGVGDNTVTDVTRRNERKELKYFQQSSWL